MQGNRTATISYTDLAGNANSSSGAAITTITVDSYNAALEVVTRIRNVSATQ